MIGQRSRRSDAPTHLFAHLGEHWIALAFRACGPDACPPELTTDGHRPYLGAVEGASGWRHRLRDCAPISGDSADVMGARSGRRVW